MSDAAATIVRFIETYIDRHLNYTLEYLYIETQVKNMIKLSIIVITQCLGAFAQSKNTVNVFAYDILILHTDMNRLL
jgi:hypothetical protein